MATRPEDAAARARAEAERLREGFQRLLEEAGVKGWRLTSFSIEPAEPTVKAGPVCGPGQEYDCRWIDGRVTCGCFPKT